jgi:PD-(D/E)XK nuclease superfamily protein
LADVFEELGTGYGSEVLSKLIVCALRQRSLSFAVAPMSKTFFRGVEIAESPLDCLVIDDRILLTFTALFDSNQFNINRGASFLAALGRQWGIAANFGKHQAQFNGLRHHI